MDQYTTNKTSARLVAFALPFLFIGTLQLAGCASNKLPPPPPGGAYRSTSGGAQFDQSVNLVDETGALTGYISQLSLRTIHRTSADPAIIYATAAGQGIVVSRDDGVTWQKANQPLASAMGISMIGDGVLLTSGTNDDGEGIIIRSLDSGYSWERVLTIPAFKKDKKPFFMEIIKPPPPPPVYVSTIVPNPFHQDRAYATTSTGDLLAGEQSGKVWYNILTVSPIGKVFPSPHQDEELLLVTTDGKLFRSQGEEEEALTLPSGAKALDAAYIKQFPDALLIGTNQGAYISRDRGVNWLKLALPISTSAPLRNIVVRVSPTNANRFLISVDSVLYRSEDGGETWNALSLNLPNHVITDISIDPQNAARVLAVTTPIQT
ncbi:MAG: hypothetical protein ABIH36_03185 [bacterium]